VESLRKEGKPEGPRPERRSCTRGDSTNDLGRIRAGEKETRGVPLNKLKLRKNGKGQDKKAQQPKLNSEQGTGQGGVG